VEEEENSSSSKKKKKDETTCKINAFVVVLIFDVLNINYL
jgi:hypothetical protein